MPALRINKVDEEKLVAYKQSIKDEIDHLESEEAALSERLACCPDTERAALKGSMEEGSRRLQQLWAFQETQALLEEEGLIAFEVPAKGDCALHSLQCLLCSSPVEANLAQVRFLRSQIASAWKHHASTGGQWVTLFEQLVLNEEAERAGKAQSDPKTPQPKSQKKQGRKRIETHETIRVYKMHHPAL